MIFTGVAPNIHASAVLKACFMLLKPWRWHKGRERKHAEQAFQQQVGAYPYLVDSGRSALYIALKAMGIGKGDEVLVQAYTCIVVSNAITWTGATPMYVDVGPDLNMDVKDAKEKISTKTKAIIIQHTFGQPANMKALLKLCKEHNLLSIEDCAHALGLGMDGKSAGLHADMGMYTFGSDKVISTMRGGALVVNNHAFRDAVRKEYQQLPQLRKKTIFQLLFQYPLFALGRATYGLFIGKGLLYVFKKWNVTCRVIYDAEKQGRQLPWFPATYPNALAGLLVDELNALQKNIAHRNLIAQMYLAALSAVPAQQGHPSAMWLRYTLLTPKASALLQAGKKRGILLGEWYNTVIAPRDADLNAAGYVKGSCPRAEQYADRSVNLPTNRNVSERDAERIIQLVKEVCQVK